MSGAAVRGAWWEQPSPQTNRPQQPCPVVAASVRPIPDPDEKTDRRRM